MKKLLMMAVVACVATFAQALTINWYTGQDATSWASSVTDSFIVYSATGKDITKALEHATGSDYSKVTGKDLDVHFISDTENDLAGFIQGVPSFATEGTYFVFVNAGEDTYGTSFDAAKATTFWYTSEGFAPSEKVIEMSDFTKVAVPEPTALALLALGVAGVALRRRRRA